MQRATDWESNFPDMYDISIHALVKRATRDNPEELARLIISIHALVKRATCAEVYRADDRRDFNPRPREEGDQIHQLSALCSSISIHALVKRATASAFALPRVSAFQSTPS